MTCCSKEKVSALSVEQVETLKLSAQNFGFDTNWIAELISKYGADILALVVEAARNGFSIALVVEIMSKFGPDLLQFVLDLFNTKKMEAVKFGEVFPPTDGSMPLPGGMMDSILINLVQKYLPIIMEKYGDQIMKMIIDAIIKAISGGTDSGPPIVIGVK